MNKNVIRLKIYNFLNNIRGFRIFSYCVNHISLIVKAFTFLRKQAELPKISQYCENLHMQLNGNMIDYKN